LTAGLAQSGLRSHRIIPYDQAFLLLTLPSTAKGTAKVIPGRGVKINHLYYWSDSDAFRDPEVEGQSVPVRYDPFNAGIAYAFVRTKWEQCHSEYFSVFQGRSEQEVRLATEELLAMRCQHARDRAVTSKRLTELLQSVEVQDKLLMQRRCDQASRKIRGVVNGVATVTDLALPEASPQAPGSATAGDARDPEPSAVDSEPYGRF